MSSVATRSAAPTVPTARPHGRQAGRSPIRPASRLRATRPSPSDLTGRPRSPSAIACGSEFTGPVAQSPRPAGRGMRLWLGQPRVELGAARCRCSTSGISSSFAATRIPVSVSWSAATRCWPWSGRASARISTASPATSWLSNTGISPTCPIRRPGSWTVSCPRSRGADLRKNATRGNARQRLHAIGFLDRILRLLQRHDVRLVAHIWVKGIGMLFDATPVYTSSIQGHLHLFRSLSDPGRRYGVSIADSRNKFKNVSVSRSIFTQEVQPVGAELPAHRRAADIRTQRQSRRSSDLRHRLLRAALPHRLTRILHGPREQHPRAARRRKSSGPLWRPVEGSPVPLPGCRDRSLPWRTRGLRRHRTPQRLADVSLTRGR